MKILLTGKPGIGKSTILKEVLGSLQMPKYGIVAEEIRNDQNQRVGFEAMTSDGKSSIFAHKLAFKTEFSVGDYYVDINAINDFIVPELKEGLSKEKSVVFVDEIGRMQSFSAEFLSIIKSLFSGKVNVLATIVFEDEPWSLEFKKYPGVILIDVNEKNREFLAEIINTAFLNAEAYDKLTSDRRKFVNEKFRNFIVQDKFIQAKKLFNNAVIYVTGGRIKKIQENNESVEYSISGRTDEHKTVFRNNTCSYECDCDLFNGRREFQGNAGECSHVMAIKIFSI